MRNWIILFCLLLVACTVEEPVEKVNIDDAVATFAGGCFWCVEAAFEALPGVSEVISGYAGGEEENPTYQEVASGKTSHREAIQIYYDPYVISYKELVDYFFAQIDPTDDTGQFVDKGFQYSTGIFYVSDEEKKIAIESKKKLEDSGRFDKPIVTEILPFKNFFKAEEYHQDYYKKRTMQYKLYERGSGRKEFREEMWGN
tara:strand:+ start:97130 stop:97729 length:600 start_codon:yes stop_codon:yes gene_type:complete